EAAAARLLDQQDITGVDRDLPDRQRLSRLAGAVAAAAARTPIGALLATHLASLLAGDDSYRDVSLRLAIAAVPWEARFGKAHADPEVRRLARNTCTSPE